MDCNLKGKQALVLGASQGIGAAVARALSELGCQIIVLARSEEKLQKTLETLAKDAGSHRAIVRDVGDKAKLKSSITDHINRHGSFDIFVNNSGGPAPGPLLEAKDEDLMLGMDHHLLTLLAVAKLVVPGMREKRWGRIVNIISTSVKIPLAGLGVSNTVRGAVASASKTLANELAPYGITVNSVLPGATRTERLAGIINNRAAKTGKPAEEIERHMKAEIPAGRFGEAHEIANAVAFLATEAAAYINGVFLPVDGGRTGSF
jgi:3-oxoacyl-[acyl-carrier protein] reductase